MSFLSFSEWLLLKEARSRKLAKNTSIDAFIKSVEELEKDVERLSKYEKSASKKKAKKRDDKKDSEEDQDKDKDDSEGQEEEREEKKKDID